MLQVLVVLGYQLMPVLVNNKVKRMFQSFTFIVHLHSSPGLLAGIFSTFSY